MSGNSNRVMVYFAFLVLAVFRSAFAAEDLILYSNFDDNQLPSYEDWDQIHAVTPNTLNLNAESGVLVITPDPAVSQEQLSFGSNPNVIQYDLNPAIHF